MEIQAKITEIENEIKALNQLLLELKDLVYDTNGYEYPPRSYPYIEPKPLSQTYYDKYSSPRCGEWRFSYTIISPHGNEGDEK